MDKKLHKLFFLSGGIKKIEYINYIENLFIFLSTVNHFGL